MNMAVDISSPHVRVVRHTLAALSVGYEIVNLAPLDKELAGECLPNANCVNAIGA